MLIWSRSLKILASNPGRYAQAMIWTYFIVYNTNGLDASSDNLRGLHQAVVGWPGLNHGMVRVLWWDGQIDMVGSPSCKHVVARIIWWGLPGFNMHSSRIVWYDEGLNGGMTMLKSWGGQGYIVGCNMTCPGFNMNMVRMQHGVARVKIKAL